MTSTINGSHYYNLIDYGIRNLSLHREQVNDLNVFPVPDGDTGTNMVLTLQNGFAAIRGREDAPLSQQARRFSDAVVFGARGNSGVIISQFFKGFSEGFYQLEEADPTAVCAAMKRGVTAAYRAVSKPVEGTILTVLREATDSLCALTEGQTPTDIDGLIDVFLKHARVSLEHTPDLLPILKSAGVVDSGGAGIIYVFEGMRKYLRGEEIAEEETAAPAVETVDYTKFNEDSSFELGYCTELLIQQLRDSKPCDEQALRAELETLGDSVVTTLRSGKIKIHVHTKTPERVMALCHAYGEFLALKIENMSVQHSEKEQKPMEKVELCRADRRSEHFSVVAVAHDPSMRRRFLEMGADAVIACDRHTPPAASDFLEAFRMVDAERIVVFPNSKNTKFAAEQAKALFGREDLYVFSTVCDAQCYAALPMIDFGCDDLSVITRDVEETVSAVRVLAVTAADKDSEFEGMRIEAGDLLAMEGNRPLTKAKGLSELLIQSTERILAEEERDVLTLFVNPDVSDSDTRALEEWLAEHSPYTELTVVPTEDDFWMAVLAFE